MKTGSPRGLLKHDRILDALRTAIVRSQFLPGAALPGHAALSRRFSVSPMTVRVALRELVHEGWLETRPRVGTFVAARPPHTCHYALVFWNDPASPLATLLWSRYYTALTQEALRLQRDGYDLQLYHGIDEHADTEDRARLIGRVQSQRLAGMIFVNAPDRLVGSPLLDEPGIPRVTMASGSAYPHVRAITFDETSWFDKALTHLAARGRRRLALLAVGLYEKRDREIVRQLRQQGFEVPSYRRLTVNPTEPLASQRCAELLLQGGAATRPDGLLILDDNLVEGVLAGLAVAGVRPPDEIDVVARANFPWPPPRTLPVRYLGFDVRQALLTAMGLIDRERRGETVPGLTRLPAVFEEELEETSPTTARPGGQAPVEQGR